jgi:hypothetical protein
VNQRFTVLNRGDLGADVAEWQTFLRTRGYCNWYGQPITVDGDFDHETEYATKCFQRDYELEQTGVLSSIRSMRSPCAVLFS